MTGAQRQKLYRAREKEKERALNLAVEENAKEELPEYYCCGRDYPRSLSSWRRHKKVEPKCPVVDKEIL